MGNELYSFNYNEETNVISGEGEDIDGRYVLDGYIDRNGIAHITYYSNGSEYNLVGNYNEDKTSFEG